MELRVARRLDGLMQGERQGRRPGPGGEPSLTRPYEPGDDVRWVDWPLSARAGEPTVRVPEIEPVLTAWALVDCSPSMAFGTRGGTKLELAQEVLAGVGAVLRRRGDRLGVVATRAGDIDLVRPPRADRRGVVAAIAAVARLAPPQGEGGRTDLVRAVSAMGRIARHRGAVVIVSDLPMQPGLERAVGALGRRHEVIAVEVRDRRERHLPDVGPVRLRDLETGARRLVDTSDPRFRDGFAAAVEATDRARAAMLARAGARHVIVETGDDWLLPLARGLARPARRRAALRA
ncbi:DUF58 domain-containing protein [Miltoncostaea marina]|uniref:DUF58 domain-containing protein n=1 Tax=Miltoncostaea marina TaxID=2843215 RepID=UPI001C3D3E20|nr:DUF58 domain-containing protein [Miltoncostaea marina]